MLDETIRPGDGVRASLRRPFGAGCKEGRVKIRTGFLAIVAAIFTAGCGSAGGTPDFGDSAADVPVDVAPDAVSDVPADLPPDAATDAPSDAAMDAPPDTVADVADVPPDGFPTSLPFAYTRDDPGPPVPASEVTEFTRKVMALLKSVQYFDYVLDTTYGGDVSSKMPDWQFWYSENFRKDGPKVTFYHSQNLNDGGHNLHSPMSHVMTDVLAAWAVTADAKVALAAEKLCKGMSASMLGMVHGADDQLPWLMSRNVVPATKQEYLTHKGNLKAVDPSGWWSDYERWNCYRFEYTDNPDLGAMWVTNMRSKDDVHDVFLMVPTLRLVLDGAVAGAAKDACTQTLGLLEQFAKDIVESDYRIRSKDADGQPFLPGYTADDAVNAKQGDVSSFIWWRDIFPMGECNQRRGSELVAYHRPVNEDCGRGEPNDYDELSFQGNNYNKGICRGYHVAHLANALVNRDAGAELLLDGLDERIRLDEELATDKYQTSVSNWWRDLSVYLVQADAYGLPLRADEVRKIHQYYGASIDKMMAWPYWDPWAESVPDGELGGFRPPDCTGTGDSLDCWFGVEDLAMVFHTCFSPFRNPSGSSWVDCALVRTPDLSLIHI